ncbi:MAG: TrmB family transcriptional regulator, partial [Ignavibacteria bacterium]|nr:TrmB family transcriptional regulator [Ignavibacteria bacterium]
YSAKRASDDIRSAYPDFTDRRIKKGIQVKSISLAGGGGTHGLDERRWLGTDDESATFILIYAGRCAFISRDNLGNPVGVIVENQMIYETQKMIFLHLWKLLK